jgi:hypothetical protein
VEAHPHSELQAFGPVDRRQLPLHVDGRRDRVRGAVEGGKVRVALRVDDVASVGRTRVLDQAAMVHADTAVLGSERAEELGRPLDVGEQERDGPLRQRGFRQERSA